MKISKEIAIILLKKGLSKQQAVEVLGEAKTLIAEGIKFVECKNCGSTIYDDDAIFCMNCGKKLKD